MATPSLANAFAYIMHTEKQSRRGLLDLPGIQPGIRPGGQGRPQSRVKTTVELPVYECRAYEIVKWELNKLIVCDMSAFEQEYSQVCL